MNYLLKVSTILLLSILVCSCETEELNADEGVVAENFGGSADGKCLEKVYPLSYELPDGSVIEVASKDELKEAVKLYKENNPDERARPNLVYPINVVTADGEIVIVESQEAHKELKKAECGERPRGPNGDRNKCFKLIYPVSFITEDGTVVTGDSRKEIKMALKKWKTENPDAEEKPVLQFPVQIINADEETLEIGSAEELEALKEEC